MSGSTMQSLEDLKRSISALHRSGDPIDDDDLDARIGLSPSAAEPRETLGDLLVTYGQHRLYRADLPYAVLRDLFRLLDLPAGATLLDLGSGYGRVAFYGYLLLGARVCGIELVRERVAEARRAQQRLGLSELDFRCGDAATADWPETSHYCVLNAFIPSVLPRVVDRLEEIARRRRIVIASVSTSNLAFDRLPWLEKTASAPTMFGSTMGLQVFASK
ncbi:MAG TPA: class I SAM-dependent methyltransferase [Thermoanaerobaculia bacterium]|nr:class I SAM-dependent methyltransferase [Thermoanaerobaculia bacterium]